MTHLDIATVFLCLFIFSVRGCDFVPGISYTCIPCGGTYDCRTTGTCVANSNDVPGCSLPDGAQFWMCCESDACTITSPFMCSYTAPPRTRPPTDPPSGGGSCSSTPFEGCQSCDACQSGCQCQCGTLGVFGFNCAQSLGNIAASCGCWSSVLLIGGLCVAGITVVIIAIVCICRCCRRKKVNDLDRGMTRQELYQILQRQNNANQADQQQMHHYAPLPTATPTTGPAPSE